MVNKLITDMSLTGNGLRDWLVQRFSSIIIGIYFIFLSIFFLTHSTIDYKLLHNLFASMWMEIFTFITLICLFLHAWVGVWTVITDYVKPIALRFIIQFLIILALAIYLLWGIVVLWKLT